MYRLTISIVICVEHNKDILDHWYKDEGVQDKRQDTQEIIVVLDAIREGA
jgi:hypothetical protein